MQPFFQGPKGAFGLHFLVHSDTSYKRQAQRTNPRGEEGSGASRTEGSGAPLPSSRFGGVLSCRRGLGSSRIGSLMSSFHSTSGGGERMGVAQTCDGGGLSRSRPCWTPSCRVSTATSPDLGSNPSNPSNNLKALCTDKPRYALDQENAQTENDKRNPFERRPWLRWGAGAWIWYPVQVALKGNQNARHVF